MTLLSATACYRNTRPEALPSIRPEPQPGALEEGWASYYGRELEGHRTASGERFNPRAFTAAHRTLPFGTCLVVQNLSNRRQVRVRVNDRGPYVRHRIIDLSEAAALRLGISASGTARVRIYHCD